MKRIRFFVAFLVMILFLIFTPACTKAEPEKVETEPAVVEELVVEEEPGVEESTDTIEENEEEIKKENINKFFEQIKEYKILDKALDYSEEVVQISLDSIDFEKKEMKLTQSEIGSRYMDLAKKVRDDYFFFDISISKVSLEKDGIRVTDDMERVIELISKWSNKKEKYYEYMAKYYWGDGPEYEIEADKIEEELDEITDEYIELTNEMTKKVKTE